MEIMDQVGRSGWRKTTAGAAASIRTATVAGLVVALMMAGGCSLSNRAERARKYNLALASGPTAMWYRFRFAARYRGQPFAFDRFVHCGVRSIPGGPFDSAPATNERAMYPRTVGQRMADGSYVIVRIPDLCRTYRAVDANQLMQPGWESRGPFEVLPLVIWNDRRPQTTTVERYVARGYYAQPGARITDPRGSVELMPAGFHPANYAALLAEPEFATTDPEENTDPETGKRFSNSYASNSNGLVAFFSVPSSDMAAALARLDDDPGKIARETKVAEIEQLTIPGDDEVRSDIAYIRKYLVVPAGKPVTLRPAPGPVNRDVDLYEDSPYYDREPFSNDPGYLPPGALSGCIADLAAGVPVLSDVPVGRGPSAGLLHPVWIARELSREKAARARSAAACAALDRLVSYDVRDGRLDAAGAIPGAIVRRQWHLTNIPERPSTLEREDVAFRIGTERLPNKYRFRFGHTDADLQLLEPEYILHDRASRDWLALFFDTDRLVSDRTIEGGW